MKTKKIISVAIITLSIFGFSTLSSELFAKKFNFKYNSGKNKTKKMKLIKSFITNTSNAGKAREIGSSFKPGQKINFYYKVGPVKVIKGKGAPFKTKLVIKKGSRTLKDFGWHKSNAVSGKNLKRNATFGWFHTSKWYLNLSKTIKPGSYTAVVTHKDQNSRSNINIRYNFMITGASHSNNLTPPLLVSVKVKKFERYGKIYYGYGTALKWRKKNRKISHWQVQYKNKDKNLWEDAYNEIKYKHGSWVNHHGSDVNGKYTKNLKSNTYYTYRVRACQNSLCSDWSNTRTIKIPNYGVKVDKKKSIDTTGIEKAIRKKNLSGIAPFIEFKTKYYSCDGSTNDKRGYFNKRQVLNWFKEAFKSSGKHPISIERSVHAEGVDLTLSVYSGMGGYEIFLEFRKIKGVLKFIKISKMEACN